MQVYNININENQMETTSHGSADFPIAVYETILSRNILGFVDWHWHNELQFCYITAGKVRFTVTGNSFDLGINEGIFINSGVLHMAKPLTHDAAYICIDASPTMLESFKGSSVEKKYITPFTNDRLFTCTVLNSEITADILKNLYSIYQLAIEKSFAYELEITALLMLCWKKVISMKADISNISTDYTRLKDILSYIHSHYREKVTLAEISDYVHLCPNECCRYFKKHMDCTIFEYINNYRLTESTYALINSKEIPISRIAYEYGFGSTSYYIEKFRKKTGVTPLSFRKNILV